MTNIFSFLGLGLALSLAVILALLLIFAFEIWMFVDVITNKAISDTAKVLWVVGMVLVHPIVAIVYYFTDHQKNQ